MATTSALDILIRARNAASPALREVSNDLGQLDKFAGLASRGLAGLVAGAGIAGLTQLGSAAIDLARVGAEAERLGASFELMARRAGASSDEMLAKLRQASQGMVADTNLILSANRAMALGVADSATEMGALMEVATARAKLMGLSTADAFNDIVTGIGRMSPLILDNLGIITGGEQLFHNYAASIGTTADALSDAERKQALVNAILRDSIPLIEGTGNRTRDAAGNFEAFAAAATNLRVELGKLASSSLGPVIEWLADVLGRITIGVKILRAALNLDEGEHLSWYAIKKLIGDTGSEAENTTYAAQALADAQDAAASGADRHALALQMLTDAAADADRMILGMAANLFGTLGAGGALSWAEQTRGELGEQARLWQDMGYSAEEIATVLIPGWLSQQRRVTGEMTRTSRATQQVNREYEDLLNKVQGVLSGALDPGVGVNPEDFLPRRDAINEDARRLADIAVNGFNSPWVEYFRSEFPALWAQHFAGTLGGGDIQAQAAQLLQEFQAGLRPELIDRARAKEMIRQLLVGEQRMGALAQELAAELAGEMGISVGQAMSAARTALGVSDQGGAGGDAAGAFDSGMVQGLTQTNTGGAFVSALAGQLRASFTLITRTGSDAGQAFAAGFAAGTAGIPETFIALLVSLITPGVEAALNQRQTQLGAVP